VPGHDGTGGEQAGLRLDQLVVEVTESEQVNDLDHLEKVFSYYRERGCKVALDDLGAGYSSLNMLVRLKPDIVKLDKEIVQRLPELVSRSVVGGRRDHPRLQWSGPGRVRRDRRAGRRRTGAGGRPGPRLVLGRTEERMNPPADTDTDTGTGTGTEPGPLRPRGRLVSPSPVTTPRSPSSPMRPHRTISTVGRRRWRRCSPVGSSWAPPG